MLDWLILLYAICTSGEPPSNWREIAFYSNIAVAVAYFWIPCVMGIVFVRWKEELPHKWLWIAFVLFITSCGLSHAAHAFHVLRDQTPHAPAELVILVVTAVVSLVTAAGFTFVLPRILRATSPSAVRRRLQAAVDRATADLNAALEHERLLLLEVHHRVKNNLQIVSSIVSLHMRRARGDTAAGLEDLRRRIVAIAAVHGQLEQVGLASLRALPFVRSLARSIEQVIGREPGTVDVQGDDFSIPLDHAVSFALIMHEVLSNALQHAYPGRQEGPVEARLMVEGARRMVSIVDHGVGMSASAPDGVGARLVKALAVQLDAAVTWGPQEGGGTRFVMAFEAQAVPERPGVHPSVGISHTPRYAAPGVAVPGISPTG